MSKPIYQQIDGDKISETARRLNDRIEERFPGSGLGKLADNLVAIAEQARRRAGVLRAPNWSVRILILLLLIALLAATAYVVTHLRFDVPKEISRATTFIQILEPALGSMFFVGAVILFLWTLEGRLKRSRALAAIHELRSLAHIVDMHQLTKDPDRLRHRGSSTRSSPKQSMSAFEMSRYFDYCAEMLSMTGKIAALYVQDLSDPVVLGAVDQVEALTTGLSRKIWQKIILLDREQDEGERRGTPLDSPPGGGG